MRLGDLDALTGKLKNGLGNAKNAGKEDYAKIFEVFIDWVSREPTISAVPVVRCRDCKWFNHYTMECESDDVATDHEGGASFSINFGPDDFCSYGQRKEAAHD